MMSSADLLEDGFPHGTPDGYDQGCHSAGGCPTGIEHGLSCKTAKMKSRSDYQYQQLVKRGATVPEIADTLGLFGTAPAAKPTKPTKAAKATKTAGPGAAPAAAEPTSGTNPVPDAATQTLEGGEPAEGDHPRSTGATGSTAPEATTPDHSTKEIRAWARERGYTVADRGRIHQDIVDHYWDAHGLLDTQPAEAPTTEAEEPVAPECPSPLQVEGTINLELDLRTATAERDRARDLAARLEQELARLEQTRTEETAAFIAVRHELLDDIDQHEQTIATLIDEGITAHHARRDLREALAAASTSASSAERALELVLQKWGDATGKAANADRALGYIDASLNGVADLSPDLTWRNDEVVEVLEEIRSLLVTGIELAGTFTPMRQAS